MDTSRVDGVKAPQHRGTPSLVLVDRPLREFEGRDAVRGPLEFVALGTEDVLRSAFRFAPRPLPPPSKNLEGAHPRPSSTNLPHRRMFFSNLRFGLFQLFIYISSV